MLVTNNDRGGRWFFYKVNGEVKRVQIPGSSTVDLPDLTSELQVINNSTAIKVKQSNFILRRSAKSDYTLQAEDNTDPLTLTWNNILNVPVADPSDVNQWNTFFNLPTNGKSFSRVAVSGNEVLLYGGLNISVSDSLFDVNSNLLSIADVKSIVSIGANSFLGCSLTAATLPVCTSISISSFDSSEIEFVNLPSCVSIGDYGFASTNVSMFNLPSCISVGNYSFAGCSFLNQVYLPKCVSIGISSFFNCINIESLELPNCATISQSAFQGCVQLSNLSIPVCTNLGGSVANNSVFNGVIGNNFTITIPSALMTNNGGNPDGDMQYLIAQNQVTLRSSDALTLTYLDISSAPVDPNSYSEWNNYFTANTTTNFETLFSGTIVSGNQIILVGATNITNFMYNPIYDFDYTSLYSFVDHSGIINSLVDNSYSTAFYFCGTNGKSPGGRYFFTFLHGFKSFSRK